MAAEAVHVTSDVTAAFLSQPPTSGKVLADRQQSFGQYARSDDVSDLLLGAGNDYFHQHRRHQFHQVATPYHHPQQSAQVLASAASHAPLDFTGTCRSDPEHIYESPNHDKARSPPSSLNVSGRQLEGSYYSEQDFRAAAS